VVRPFSSTSAYLASTLLLAFLGGGGDALAQVSVLTHHYDNSRTGQNTNETILTHTNVNSTTFGKLFTQPLDGQNPGQPLYVPNVLIPATNTTHNVVYVATQHDSVYAFDADSNQGSNASPLWQVSFLDPANGVTSVPVADEVCINSGYSEFGIQGTPVIDPARNAIYVLAMTKENGAYVHRLHALDVGTGAELFGGPVTITGSFVNQGNTYNFIDKHQQQRPGLLLQNGIVYIGFGSPGCNLRTEMGWVMAYDGGTLGQVGVFDVSPGVMASAVWMSGAGLAGDGLGNVFFSTGDGQFDNDTGGGHFGNSVLKLNQGNGVLNLGGWFTPYNQSYLQANNLDLGAGQVMILPEQGGRILALAVDKDGTLYLLDPDNLGQYNPAGDFQIPQELSAPVLGSVHAGLTYWNGFVYVLAEKTPAMAYSFSNGQLSLQPVSQATISTAHPTGGIVSSNGKNNGIFWYATSPTNKLFAFDATDLTHELYDSGLAGTRDSMAPLVHFTMPIVADGRVYVNGQTQLTVFGLLPIITVLGGNNQTGAVGTTLPNPLQIGLLNPYSGQAIQQSGVPITFTASGNLGSFSNPQTTTDGSGTASTNYTLPAKPGTYTITASSPGYVNATFTVTAISGGPTAIVVASGNNQSAQVTATFAKPLKVKVKDAQGNGVPGVVVTFSDGGAGGTLSPSSATTDASGFASTFYTAGTRAGKVSITASSPGLASAVFGENVLAGPPASLAIYAGNNQTVAPGAATAKLLQVIIADQYNNPVKGIAVTYSDGGAGGTFSLNPALTSAKGIAGTRYTAPAQPGTVTITASAAGLTPVNFTVNVQ
jgi:hypothetical protein